MKSKWVGPLSKERRFVQAQASTYTACWTRQSDDTIEQRGTRFRPVSLRLFIAV